METLIGIIIVIGIVGLIGKLFGTNNVNSNNNKGSLTENEQFDFHNKK